MVLAGLPAEVAPILSREPSSPYSLFCPLIIDEQHATLEVHAQMSIIVLRSMS